MFNCLVLWGTTTEGGEGVERGSTKEEEEEEVVVVDTWVTVGWPMS